MAVDQFGQPIQNAPDLIGFARTLADFAMRGGSQGKPQVTPAQSAKPAPQMPAPIQKQVPTPQPPVAPQQDALKAQAYQDYMKYLYMRGARRAAMKGTPLPLSETQEQQFPEQVAQKAGLAPKPIDPHALPAFQNYLFKIDSGAKIDPKEQKYIESVYRNNPELASNTMAMARENMTKQGIPLQREIMRQKIEKDKIAGRLEAIDKTTSARQILMEGLERGKMSREEFKQAQANARHAGDLEVKGKSLVIKMEQLQLQAEEAIARPFDQMAIVKAKMSIESLKADREKIKQQISVLSSLQKNPSLKPKQQKEIAAKLAALIDASPSIDEALGDAEAKLSPYTSPALEDLVKKIRQGVPEVPKATPSYPQESPPLPPGIPADQSQVGERIVGGTPITGAPIFTMDQARAAVKKRKPNWTPAQIDAAVYVSRDKGNVIIKE